MTTGASRSPLRAWTDADVVTFDGAHECFGHSLLVTRSGGWLRRWRASCGYRSDVALPCLRAFDGDWQAIDPATDAQPQSPSGPPPPPDAAVARSSWPRDHSSSAKATALLTVVAPISKPSEPNGGALIYCTTVVRRRAANVAIEQEAVDLHHAVDPFVIGRLATSGQSLSLEDGVDPPITVGRQPAMTALMSATSLSSGSGGRQPLLRTTLQPFDQIGARHPDHLCHGFHREPSFGSDGGSRSCFEPMARSSASLRSSVSRVFLPSSR